MFVTIMGLQLIRRVPLSLQLLDQTLTRLADLIVSVATLLT